VCLVKSEFFCQTGSESGHQFGLIQNPDGPILHVFRNYQKGLNDIGVVTADGQAGEISQ